MFICEIEEYTHNGDCDICVFGLIGECHLQCTHEQFTDECDGDCENCLNFCTID